MTLPQQLLDAGLPVFPCTADKNPAIPKGTNWQTADPSKYDWSRAVYVGVPVPAGVVVIDLDLYKGVTREQVEAAVGSPLPWDEALVQGTQSGGEHYAFRAEGIRQGSNLLDVKGFDTRVGGKGYICTGEPGYNSYGFGLFRMASAESLPALPHRVVVALGQSEPTLSTTPAETADTDAATVASALKHIDPACSRSTWIKVGMALRAWGHTDGLALFGQWSSGALGGHETPANYVEDHVAWQWQSFKPEGDTTLGSLFYEAIEGGWVPPARISTAGAFGPGAADAAAFDTLVDRIQATGCDPKATDGLLSDIRTLGPNALQLATLLALLTRSLKEAGLLTRPVREQLDALAGSSARPRAQGVYAGNHTENATLFIEKYYPSGGLQYADQTWFTYTGKAWAECEGDMILAALTRDMLDSLPQASVIEGTYRVLRNLSHQPGALLNDISTDLILFQNGVLDRRTGLLGPHSQAYFTTNILPYDYAPAAGAPHWLAFLESTLEGDAQRIALLQEWMGYMLSNSYEHHKILLMLGPARSGKGTIGRVLKGIVGAHNYTGCSLEQLASDSFLDSLRTRSVAFSGDTAKSVSRNAVNRVIENLKKISGGDEISFSRKYKSNASQVLPTRITLAGNGVPRLFDDSGALARRMMILPFNVSYLDREDLHLEARLMAELAGIAVWALEGWRRLTVQGAFTHPEASMAEEDFLQESYSPLQAFLRKVCVFTGSPDDRMSGVEIYHVYRAWALGEGEIALTRHTFTTAFKDATRGSVCRYGVHRMGGDTVRGYTGIQTLPVQSTSGAFTPAVVK